MQENGPLWANTPLFMNLLIEEVCQVSLLNQHLFLALHSVLALRRHLGLSGLALTPACVSSSVQLKLSTSSRESLHECLHCHNFYCCYVAASTCNCELVSFTLRGCLSEAFKCSFIATCLSEPVQFCFLFTDDLKAFCCASASMFFLVQSTLRARRLLALAGPSESFAPLGGAGNCIEIAAFDRGAVYRCTLCRAMFLTRTACASCHCRICSDCEGVLPVHSIYFDVSCMSMCVCDNDDFCMNDYNSLR